MKLLAIDPGTNLVGLYCNQHGARVLNVRPHKKAPRAERLACLAAKLSDELAGRDYDFVVYEEQFTRGNAATRALYGAVGVIEAVAIACGAGAMPIPQPTIRKWAKGQIIAYQDLDPKRLYRVVASPFPAEWTQDEVDAYVIYKYATENVEFN